MSNGAATALPQQQQQQSNQDLLHEAFTLHKLETQTNSSLLDYGLDLGFIERRPNDGRVLIELLNAYPMSTGKFVESLLGELLLRLGIFIPATSLIKIAIDLNDEEPDRQDLTKCVFILSMFLHQIVNFDEVSIRTINRLLMCVAIILFSLTRIDSRPCEDMRKFKHKLKRRLLIDYYLWCLMFAVNFALTCSSSIYISLERVHGIELHILQNLLNTYAIIHLCYSMKSIGYGRLAPLIIGTPLLFFDVGVDITAAKGFTLFLSYFCFWLSDWRELADWNHTMLCEAGICRLLDTEPGSLMRRVKKAKRKFDEWRLEEGLDDDGWFILLDTPPINLTTTNGATIRPHANETSSSTSGSSSTATTTPGSSQPNNSDRIETDNLQQQGEDNERTDRESRTNNDSANSPETTSARNDGGEQEGDTGQVRDDAQDEDLIEGQQQLIDYSDRVIYLQSRHPLLTSLAAIMLIVWK